MFGFKLRVERTEHALSITIEEDPSKADARREVSEALSNLVDKMEHAGYLPDLRWIHRGQHGPRPSEEPSS